VNQDVTRQLHARHEISRKWRRRVVNWRWFIVFPAKQSFKKTPQRYACIESAYPASRFIFHVTMDPVPPTLRVHELRRTENGNPVLKERAPLASKKTRHALDIQNAFEIRNARRVPSMRQDKVVRIKSSVQMFVTTRDKQSLQQRLAQFAH
jgi:hypothetical protein